MVIQSSVYQQDCTVCLFCSNEPSNDEATLMVKDPTFAHPLVFQAKKIEDFRETYFGASCDLSCLEPRIFVAVKKICVEPQYACLVAWVIHRLQGVLAQGIPLSQVKFHEQIFLPIVPSFSLVDNLRALIHQVPPRALAAIMLSHRVDFLASLRRFQIERKIGGIVAHCLLSNTFLRPTADHVFKKVSREYIVLLTQDGRTGFYQFCPVFAMGRDKFVRRMKPIVTETENQEPLVLALPTIERAEELSSPWTMPSQIRLQRQCSLLAHLKQQEHMESLLSMESVEVSMQELPSGLRGGLMPYCDGGSLDTILKGSSPLSDRINMACELVFLVSKLHERGVYHLDLKPSNVLIHYQEGRPHCKVIDFGCAEIEPSSHRPLEYSMTYKPPEMAFQKGYVRSSFSSGTERVSLEKIDVWLMADLLYLLIYKRAPFFVKYGLTDRHVTSCPELYEDCYNEIYDTLGGSLDLFDQLLLRMYSPSPEMRPGLAEVRVTFDKWVATRAMAATTGSREENRVASGEPIGYRVESSAHGQEVFEANKNQKNCCCIL